MRECVICHFPTLPDDYVIALERGPAGGKVVCVTCYVRSVRQQVSALSATARRDVNEALEKMPV